MKKALLFFIAFSAVFQLQAQNTLGTLFKSDDALEGLILFSPRTTSDDKFTYLINNCGEVVNQWPSTFRLFSTDYLLEDGSLFRSVIDDQSTLDLPGNTGRIEHLDWDGNLIWGLTYSDTDFSFHHDYVPMANGNVLMLVAVRRTQAEAIANGRDPATLTQGDLYEERLLEIEPVGTDGFNIVWEWRSWDHLIQDFDNTKANFGVVEDHPELMDINFGTSAGEADWWHSNAISYSPELDQIIISNRNPDEFVIIDHSTTTAEAATSSGGNSDMGGTFLYRWGNPQSYRKGTPSDQVLFGQHDVQFINAGLPFAGKIMIFNNGNELTFSKVQIITPPYNPVTQRYDYDGTAYGPETSDWEYVDPVDPDNFHAPFLSGAQQLENGNVIICNGPFGDIFEVDNAGNTVLTYQSPVANGGILTDGTDPDSQQTRVFRAVKYPLDYPGFDGRDLSGGAPIELNPADFDCTLLSLEEQSIADRVNIFPTLSSGTVNIQTSYTSYTTTVYDLNGRSVLKAENKSRLDLTNLDEGLYFIHFDTNGRRQTFKVIKQN